MKYFRKVLVPVDLAESEMTAPAVEMATVMVKASGGELRLLNIMLMMPATFMDYVPQNFDREQREKSEAGLAELKKTLELPADKVSHKVRVGGVYPEILAEAAEWGADLIVIGSHRPTMATYLIGSNAKTVVRHATCSVLVVRT